MRRGLDRVGGVPPCEFAVAGALPASLAMAADRTISGRQPCRGRGPYRQGGDSGAAQT
jgi:hypothetical protein